MRPAAAPRELLVGNIQAADALHSTHIVCRRIIFIVSILGSFLYGFVIPRTISASKKEILLTGFCSCFTSFSAFFQFLYQLAIQGYYLKLFLYLNIIVILNLIIMYLGFFISRKII